MGSTLLKKWTIGFTDYNPEKVMVAGNDALSLIKTAYVQEICENINVLLEDGIKHIDAIKTDDTSALIVPIDIEGELIVQTLDGSPICSDSGSYADIEANLYGFELASIVNAVLNHRQHDKVLKNIIRLRLADRIQNLINHSAETDDDLILLVQLAETDRSSFADELLQMSETWHKECTALFSPYIKPLKNGALCADTFAFQNEYCELDFATRTTQAMATMKNLFSDYLFVAKFITEIVEEAKSRGTPFLPFCNLSEIGYTSSSSLVLQGICLGAHLEDPTRVSRYISLANIAQQMQLDGRPPPGNVI